MATFDLKACLRGDPDAWRAFVDRYGRVIYAAAGRTARTYAPQWTDEDVEDAAQDVLVRLIRNDYRLLRRFDPARAALATYLTIVARSVTIDRIRRRRVPTVELPTGPGEPAAPQAPSAEVPTVPDGLLSERQQAVMRLLFDEQMSVDQAAAALGVEAQTIRSTKHKALEKLRRHFSRRE